MKSALKRPNPVHGSILSAAHNLTVERLISPNEKNVRVISLALAALLLVSACFALRAAKSMKLK